jgi:hypothetical protein
MTFRIKQTEHRTYEYDIIRDTSREALADFEALKAESACVSVRIEPDHGCVRIEVLDDEGPTACDPGLAHEFRGTKTVTVCTTEYDDNGRPHRETTERTERAL